jgi:hypothetical protein
MTVGIGYPLAFTIATVLAISSARASDVLDRSRLDFEIPPWLVYVFLVVLGLASFAVGILNPETMALVGLEGIAAP